MQKPSSVSSGNISPAIVGLSRDGKEVYILGGVVSILAIVLGAFWYYSGPGQSYASKTQPEALTNSQVTNALKTSATQPVESIMTNQMVPASSHKVDSVHTDIYFEVGRKGLTDDAKAILATQADLAKNDPDLGILVLGHTDQQGSATYNMKLGMKRAETVKAELLNAGVAEQQIKAVSLGEEGVLCIDNSDICRNMNRRVHLEIRKIGKDHMTLLSVATEPTPTEPIRSAEGLNSDTDGHGSLAETLLPSLADPPGTDPSPSVADPDSGS